ncbi:hypothetical protein ACFWPV_09905 [Streptomyces uncialis]|uniref:hypothetical protein n=1 Tax=Streptomyces uncialis TaxID=1048205 RepID=UPI00364C614F
MRAAGPKAPPQPSPFVRYRVDGEEPRRDPLDPARSSAETVAYHLARLGLGVTEIRGHTGLRMVVPDGTGVCRTDLLPEAAWPPGVELCTLVRWTPDRRYQHDTLNRHAPVTVPAGAEHHWRDQVAATIAALESLGLVAEEAGPPRLPGYHASAELLVYRWPPGVTGPRQPDDAWEGWPPQTPNFQTRYRYPAPAERVTAILDNAGMRPRWPVAPTGHGACVAQSLTQTAWPVGFKECALVIWQPDPGFVCTETGRVSGGAEDHWKAGAARIRELLEPHGYTLISRERPVSPETDDEVTYLAGLSRREDPTLPEPHHARH